jgi:hypothetical protein
MKKIIFFFCILSFVSQAQRVIPFTDFNGYFRSFENDNFRQIEFQEIQQYKAGDELVAYIDTRGNLRIYDGDERKDITPMQVNFEVSDHLLAYSISNALTVWDKGKLKLLTYFASDYKVKDSIVVFQDTRFNNLQVYWNGQISQLVQGIGPVSMPSTIGDNIVAFKDNGDVYKVFWRGQTYELGVWNGAIEFSMGTDILCFNDPTTRTFAIFENGQFLDVEQFYINKYKAGRGLVAYEDVNRNLIVYVKGKTEQLSNFNATFWDVNDEVIIWGENSFTYGYQNGQKIQLSTYTPKEYKLKNNIIAFRNQLGGVSALIDGKVVEITNQINSEFEIYGNAVLVRLFNRSVIIYKNGRKFEA